MHLLRLAILLLFVFDARLKAAPRVIEIPLWEEIRTEQTDQEPNYEPRGEGAFADRWVTGVSKPILTVYLPDQPTGAACLVCPGGGYFGLALDKEGHYPAKWMAERGVVGVVVPYRCGAEQYRHPIPITDGQRAIRLVRSKAQQWNVDQDKVGVMGFSAGGHLAATLATHKGPPYLSAEDLIGLMPTRPDFAVLVYPVITLRDDFGHRGSRNNLLGKSPPEELVAQLSADEQVSSETPPTFLIHSGDDSGVPVENSLRFYAACQQAGAPAELHVYPTGGHGGGMWQQAGSVANWPTALENWLVAQGLARSLDE